ncbi:MAG: hypothetical protein H0W77_14965 [Acidobacteria bacterium]|nr:hypothetical protein [Acidobacteriota bacterium]
MSAFRRRGLFFDFSVEEIKIMNQTEQKQHSEIARKAMIESGDNDSLV